jgi:hypothetical protein
MVTTGYLCRNLSMFSPVILIIASGKFDIALLISTGVREIPQQLHWCAPGLNVLKDKD